MNALCRWVGGKSAILDQIFAHIPRTDGRLFIPFLGGGSDALHAVANKWAGGYVLSDTNGELINAYLTLRQDPDRLFVVLRDYEREHAEEYPESYYKAARSASCWPQQTALARTARFLFLINTCFNGIWRENQDGQMNSPWGKRLFRLTPDYEAQLRCVASLLNTVPDSGHRVHIAHADFVDIIQWAKSGDVIYADPPYVPTSRTASFASYSRKRFDLDEHRRLYAVCVDAAKRGVKVYVSNSDAPAVWQIYRCAAPYVVESSTDYPNPAHRIAASRRVAANGSRVGASELLIEVRG